jgi:hypothetical protein
VRSLVRILESNDGLRLGLSGFNAANSHCMEGLCELELSQAEQNMKEIVADRKQMRAVIERLNSTKAPMLHPFTGERVTRIVIKKQFHTSVSPMWLELYDGERKLAPDVIAKEGDDLRKDLAVQQIFRAIQSVLIAVDETWRCGVPIVQTFRVLVTGPKNGYIEFVPGRNTHEVKEQRAWDQIDLHYFASTIL